MVDLGSAFTVVEDPIDLLAADIERRVLEGVKTALRELQPPDVVVQPANVKVNAKAGAIDVNVELPGIDRLVKVLNDLKGLLAAPTVRTVTRDDEGLILSVKETR